MTNYPSDISREQFERIKEDLEKAKKKTKPRKLDIYDVFNGVLYVMSTCCQWRALPKDYPNWKSVHAYFMKWSKVLEGEKESILSTVLKKIGRTRTYTHWSKLLYEHGYNRRAKC